MSAGIIVVGGGIGGLTAAICLLQAGRSVLVLEQAPELAEIGAGVTLSPNAMKVFSHLGLAERIAAAGVEPARQRIQHWEDGRTLVTLERGDSMRRRYGAPYVYIHRADLQAILASAVATHGGVVQTNAPVIAVRALSKAAVATLADGRELRASLIVGADGLKSSVRRLYEPEKPHFTGHVAWRALVPVNAALRDLAGFPGMHVGPGRLAVRYPVRGGEMLNLVFFARQSGWAEEGWTIPSPRRDLEAAFAGWCRDVQVMIASAPEDRLFKWAIHARRPLKTWVAGNRIVLLGDAAHAMTPFLGQGAACAIEDALVLARALKSSRSRAEGLARYEAARAERTAFIQIESNMNADRIQGDEPELFGVAKMRNEESLGLFDYDAGVAAV